MDIPDVIYLIGAVAVIALLALVLILVLRGVRAGKHQEAVAPEPAFFEAASDWASGPDVWPGDDEPPADAASDAEPAVEADAVTAATGAAPMTEAEPPTPEAGPPMTDAEPPTTEAGPPAPSTTRANPPAIGKYTTDPAVILVNALLQNSGELNPAEFRRLELYRPERLVEAVDALTPTMTGRAKESKRQRLQRIRHYALSLMAQESESEAKTLITQGTVISGAPTVAPAPTDPLMPAEEAYVPPPADWGAPADGSELTLDTELSLLPDDLSPAPELAETPAAEPEAEETEPEAEETEPEAEESPTPAPGPSVDDLASLSPRELGDALALSDDLAYKKAAIDALARLDTPESLTQLQHALENPDPDVQLYALSVAERLLD